MSGSCVKNLPRCTSSCPSSSWPPPSNMCVQTFFCIKYVARNNVSFGKPQASAQYGARIVGGTSSEPGEFPYLVALTVRVPLGAAFCGGTILDARRVLTAAHCMETAQSVTITAGAYNQAEDEPTQQTRYDKKIARGILLVRISFATVSTLSICCCCCWFYFYECCCTVVAVLVLLL